jgi:16S rRNA (guanine(966)-N(2))-methyltransferase RsmD
MVIRIIGGEFRSRPLIEADLDAKVVRPILARVRKSLFDIIKLKVGNARFLDLYSGTGAVGIEALSRGADVAVFIDMQKTSIDVLNLNIEKFKIKDRTHVAQANVLSGLTWLKHKTGIDCFDIIFLGPPYKEQLVKQTLTVISESGVLAQDGLIIAQHQIKEDVSTDLFEQKRQERYGDTTLTFYKNRVITV